jgi:hypothetical protein
VIAVVTWGLTGVRNGISAAIQLLDGGGHLGLMRLFRWVEGSWSVIGLTLVVLLPLLAVLLALITIATLWGVRAYVRRREERLKVACTSCATAIHRSAISCPNCHTVNPHPLQVGVFGQATELPATDLSAQRVALLSRHRCPVCATPISQRGVAVSCQACGTVPFADIAALNVYLRAIDQRQPRTLLICALFGLIPVVGIVPAMITYRLSLAASLSGYVPRATGCFTIWGLRLLTLVLLPWQAVPVFGALVVPLIALIGYRVNRQVLISGALSKLPAVAPVSAPSAGSAAS